MVNLEDLVIRYGILSGNSDKYDSKHRDPEYCGLKDKIIEFDDDPFSKKLENNNNISNDTTSEAKKTSENNNDDSVNSKIDSEKQDAIKNNSITKILTGKQITADTDIYDKDITATGTYKKNNRELKIDEFINSDSASLTTDSIGTIYNKDILLEDTLTTNNETNYTVYSDNLGQFSFGYKSAATPPLQDNSGDFWYLGTSVDESNFNTSKILVYKGNKFLEVTKSGGEMISDVELKNSSKLLYVNTLNKSMTYLDMDKYKNGASYDAGFLNTSDGTFTFTSLNKYENSPGTVYKENKASEGSIYGSVAQGLGFIGESEISDSSDNLIDRTNTIGVATLDTSYNINTPSNSNTNLRGFINKISDSDGPLNAQILDLYVNKYTGSIVGNLSDENSICSGLCSNPDIFSGTTSAKSSYYINNDLFGVKTIEGEGYLVALPDGIDDDNKLYLYDDESSWGYWTSYSDINRYSTWVAGVETSTDYITSLMDNASSITKTFSGHVLGAVTNNTNIDPIKFDSSNYANFTFNFGAGTDNFSGNMGFTTVGNQQWAVTINNGTMNSSGFSSSNIIKDSNYSSAINIASSGNSISGEYYGSDLKSIGGKFDLKDSTGVYNAVGVFKAKN